MNPIASTICNIRRRASAVRSISTVFFGSNINANVSTISQATAFTTDRCNAFNPFGALKPSVGKPPKHLQPAKAAVVAECRVGKVGTENSSAIASLVEALVVSSDAPLTSAEVPPVASDALTSVFRAPTEISAIPAAQGSKIGTVTLAAAGCNDAARIQRLVSHFAHVIRPSLGRPELIHRYIAENLFQALPIGTEGSSLNEQGLGLHAALQAFLDDSSLEVRPDLSVFDHSIHSSCFASLIQQSRVPLIPHYERIGNLIELHHVAVMPMLEAEIAELMQLVLEVHPHLVGTPEMEDAVDVFAYYLEIGVSKMFSLDERMLFTPKVHELVVEACRLISKRNVFEPSLPEAITRMMSEIEDYLTAHAGKLSEPELHTLQHECMARLMHASQSLPLVLKALRDKGGRAIGGLEAEVPFRIAQLTEQERFHSEARVQGRLAHFQAIFQDEEEENDNIEGHTASSCKSNLMAQAFKSEDLNVEADFDTLVQDLVIPEAVNIHVNLKPKSKSKKLVSSSPSSNSSKIKTKASPKKSAGQLVYALSKLKGNTPSSASLLSAASQRISPALASTFSSSSDLPLISVDAGVTILPLHQEVPSLLLPSNSTLKNEASISLELSALNNDNTMEASTLPTFSSSSLIVNETIFKSAEAAVCSSENSLMEDALEDSSTINSSSPRYMTQEDAKAKVCFALKSIQYEEIEEVAAVEDVEQLASSSATGASEVTETSELKSAESPITLSQLVYSLSGLTGRTASSASLLTAASELISPSFARSSSFASSNTNHEMHVVDVDAPVEFPSPPRYLTLEDVVTMQPSFKALSFEEEMESIDQFNVEPSFSTSATSSSSSLPRYLTATEAKSRECFSLKSNHESAVDITESIVESNISSLSSSTSSASPSSSVAVLTPKSMGELIYSMSNLQGTTAASAALALSTSSPSSFNDAVVDAAAPVSFPMEQLKSQPQYITSSKIDEIAANMAAKQLIKSITEMDVEAKNETKMCSVSKISSSSSSISSNSKQSSIVPSSPSSSTSSWLSSSIKGAMSMFCGWTSSSTSSSHSSISSASSSSSSSSSSMKKHSAKSVVAFGSSQPRFPTNRPVYF